MMNEIKKVLSIALKEEGYLEKKTNSQLDSKTDNAGINNYTKYARDLDNITNFYNGKKNGFAWCDVFIDWCFVQAFGVKRAKELLNQPDNSLGAGTKYSAGYYKNKNQYFKTPQTGDQIFFKNSKGICHTGLVYNVDDEFVYTIEGNTSSANGVVYNGGAVVRKKYRLNYNNIDGYGRPLYKNKEEEEMRFNKIEEIPEYARATIQKLVNKNIINGNGDGLNLSEDMIRMFVFNDRAKLYENL